LNDDRPRHRHRILFWREPTRNNGADLCVAAFDRLAPQFPDVSFDFAIRPVPEREVPGLAELEARHDNVHVHRFPYHGGPGLPELIAESLLVVMPFRKLTINPQLAIAESLAAGVPVIASDIGSNPEIVEHGRTGMVLPVGEPEPIADAVRRLLGNRAQLLEMGRCAAATMAERWNWNGYVEELVTLYRQVAGSGRPPGGRGDPVRSHSAPHDPA
jgi:glycosyltransferase involved in cell wall biosynthesis